MIDLTTNSSNNPVSSITKIKSFSKELSPLEKAKDKILTDFAIQSLQSDNFEKSIEDIGNFKRENNFDNEKIEKILINNGFNIKDVKKITSNVWNHGDAINGEQSEQMLKNAPHHTWLLRYSTNQNCFMISKRTKAGITHITLKGSSQEEIEKLKNGYSLKYSIKDMLLTTNTIKNAHINYGNINGEAAENILKDTSTGAWILRYSENKNRYFMTVKVGKRVIHYPLEKFQSTFSLNGKLNSISATLKKFDPSIKLSPHGKGSKLNQRELTFNYLISKNHIGAALGFSKLSRRNNKLFLDSSYIFKNLSPKNKGGAVDHSTLSVRDAKIYKVIHGEKGVLGSGGMKIAKYLENIQTGEKIVKSKFKNYTAEQLEYNYPEMKKIFKLLKHTPFVATGSLITMENKMGQKIPSILGEYAVMDLYNAILKNVFSDSSKIEFAKQMLTGLVEVHRLKIAHRDLKPENINIYEDPITHEFIAKLADWDFATQQDNPPTCGSPDYMAPEIKRGKSKCIDDLQKGDVYSMGTTLFVMFYGKLPESHYLPPLPNTIEHLIWEMIQTDPKKRPTAQKVLFDLNTLITSNIL